MAGAFGVTSKLMIGTASGTPSVPLPFLSESLAMHKTIFDGNALAGTRTRFADRARQSIQPISGSLSLEPTPIEMQSILPWVLGGTPATTSYPLSDTLLTQSYWALRGVAPSNAGKIFKYPVVGVNRGTFSANQGGPLAVNLDLVGTTEDSATGGGSFPSYTEGVVAGPWMFHELVLTVNSSARKPKNISITIDNAVAADRFFNSQALQTVQATDRIITVSHDFPYGDEATAYGMVQTGVTCVAVFTQGVYILTFNMPLVQYEDISPVVNDRGEQMLRLSGTARGTSAALDELTTTLAVS